MKVASNSVADLVALLRDLIGKRPVALLDWPVYANAGDHFIWLGTQALLRGRLKCDVLLEAAVNRIDFQALCNLPPECVLFCQGGGNLGDLYPLHQRVREGLIAAFPDQRIVIGPQSVNFRTSERFSAMCRTFALHSDLHVITRDRQSFERLAPLPPNVRRYLRIDCAFALGPVVKEIQRHLGRPTRAGAMQLFRRDGERSADAPDPSGAIDWADRDDLAEFAARAPDVAEFPLASQLFTSEFDRRSWPRLWAAVRMFHEASFLSVDRLHAHILAELMHKPHQVIDDAYAKTSNFIETWPDRSRWLRAAPAPSIVSPQG